jgi:uncharacterized coiled-coil DUF342 family protein
MRGLTDPIHEEADECRKRLDELQREEASLALAMDRVRRDANSTAARLRYLNDLLDIRTDAAARWAERRRQE